MTDTWGAKRKMMLFGRREEQQTLGSISDRQKQGAERKRILFSKTKSRHHYLEGKCTA